MDLLCFVVFILCFITTSFSLTPSAWGPTPVEIGSDMFKFQCRITNVGPSFNTDQYISRIQISRSPKFTGGDSDNTFGTIEDLVRVDFDEASNGKTITWTNKNVEAKARVSSGKKMLNESYLRLVIDADAVDCSDEGRYICFFYGNGLFDPDTQMDFLTANRYIQLTAPPWGISDITAKPFLTNDIISIGSNASLTQCMAREQATTIFAPGTRIALNCTAVVGYPPQPIKWCRRRPLETDFTDFKYSSILTQFSDARLSTTCIIVTTSLLFYETNSEDEGTEFVCHVGNDAECSTTGFSDYITIHVDANTTPANVGDLDECLKASVIGNFPDGGLVNIEALSTPTNLSTPWMVLGIALLITGLVVLAGAAVLFYKARKLQNSLASDKEREKYQTLVFNRTSEGETITYETMTDNTGNMGNLSPLAFDNNDAIYAIAR